MPPKPPPKKITSFRQIDISKLDVKDLQNIDYQKLFKDVRQRPDTAISFAIPVIALLICFNMFTKFQSEQKNFSNSITEMKEKIKLVEEYTAAEAELKTFTQSLPPNLTENEFINNITDWAVKNNIQIESYTPGQSRNEVQYDLMSISLIASTAEFADLIHFVSDLENSGLAIRINTWSGSLGARSQASANRRLNTAANSSDTVVNFRVDIAAVNFKL